MIKIHQVYRLEVQNIPKSLLLSMAKFEFTVKTWNWEDYPTASCAGFATAPTIVDDDHCTTALDQMISFALMPSDSLIQLRGKVNWLILEL